MKEYKDRFTLPVAAHFSAADNSLLLLLRMCCNHSLCPKPFIFYCGDKISLKDFLFFYKT